MKHYGPEYWDKHGAYRTPIGFTLALMILLRPYLIWAFAAISRRPELDLVALVYRQKQDFFVALAIAAIAIVPATVYSLRRPGSNPKLKSLWRHMRWPLVLCAVLDLAWLILQASQQYYRFSFYIAVQAVAVAWIILYLMRSRYLRVFFADWPDELESKKQDQKNKEE
ncbi:MULTISPECIES: DUF2919 domain-containing protein [unclassified Pseudoalteromonas]|uniref:DUF2919 domain-containing protein n=1 Tax=unclassified Pseudoalteromonas TaxID=194690 RepID=UPI0018F89F36|nr:DUF2919 domain-containing protein [Pseudoalteromonas sp. T1lg48]MBS3798948.1 DUF2919 domain-containing protein [Pseudoalteromonas sp. BDTF-M6]